MDFVQASVRFCICMCTPRPNFKIMFGVYVYTEQSKALRLLPFLPYIYSQNVTVLHTPSQTQFSLFSSFIVVYVVTPYLTTRCCCWQCTIEILHEDPVSVSLCSLQTWTKWHWISFSPNVSVLRTGCNQMQIPLHHRSEYISIHIHYMMKLTNSGVSTPILPLK